MPSITIKEFDNTVSGNIDRGNFSVCVFGRVADAAKFKEKADDFDVAEFYSVEDFKKYADIVPNATTSGNALAPSFLETALGNRATVEAAMSAAVDKVGQPVYKLTPSSSITSIGYLQCLIDEVYYAVSEYKTIDEADFNEDGSIKSGILFKYINLIKEYPYGKDASATDGKFCGNQIAYELLKLGYTVVYKKIDSNVTQLNSDITGVKEADGKYVSLGLADKSKYDFRYIIAGEFDNTGSMKAILDVARARKDCFAVCDILESTYADGAVTTTSQAIANIRSCAEYIFGLTSSGADIDGNETGYGKYGMAIAPFVEYKKESIDTDGAYGGSRKLPGSFHYLACAMKAFKNFNEWYAVAGYTRGISPLEINSVSRVFGEEAVNALQPRSLDEGKNQVAVNLIIKDRNVGYTIWGNRTGEVLVGGTGDKSGLRASHFLNIRQLCCTIKKQLYNTCKALTWDPNSDVLWINFCDRMRPTLEKMKADQGISDYRFIQVKNKAKAMMKAKIKIIPIEAVEDFDISFYLEDSILNTNAESNEE